MNRFSRGGFERSLERFWYGQSDIGWVLQPFAFLFRALVALRARAYKSGILRRERIPVPVIVVGNITVGGTGKTPVVSWLATQLSDCGRKPGIVSRGYGARTGHRLVMVTAKSSYQDVGDEPVVLARQTGAPICIGVDRVAAARYLVEEAGVDVVISDDGLQHYRMIRDFEIAVVDGQRILGNRRMLPAGPLREPPERMDKVDIVLVNGDSDYTGGHRFHLFPGQAVCLGDMRRCDLSEFRGMKVWAVAGIGNPERFLLMLKSFAMDPVLVDMPDHGVVSLSALRRQQSWPILMTQKDAVKYIDMPLDDAWYIPVKVQMSEGTKASIMKQIHSVI
jgi:tetraacyldisaccharide 4'-kinase